MGAAAVGMQAAGAATSAYGSYQNGLAQDSYYRYIAANKRQQGDMAVAEADRQSGQTQDDALLTTKALNRKEDQTEGSQATAEAANGTAGSVTAADIATDTFRKAQMDRMLIKYNADRTSWATRQNAALQKWQLDNSAAEDETAGKAAKQAGKIGAFNSLLGGSGQVASSWYKLRQSAPSAGA